MIKNTYKILSIIFLILIAGLGAFFYLKAERCEPTGNINTVICQSNFNQIFKNDERTMIISVPAMPPPAPSTTTLFFAGDIMLSRNVHRRIEQTNDYTLPFRNISEISSKADIAFANLESPFNNTGPHFVDGSLIFNADPKSVEGLKSAGFDIISTANNHSFDQLQKGLDYTIDWLTANNIIYTGTKHSKAQLVEPIIKHNDTLFGFLAYSYTAYNDGGKSTHPQINTMDITKLKQDIIDMKGHTADVVIVSMHAGTEYERNPNQNQIDFAHAAIDAGADMVIGHHPHWIQTIEQYKGKYIFYSLGNFVFDQMWSQDTREGLTLFVTYQANEIKKIEVKPVIIENYCCPGWAMSAEAKVILEKINPGTNTPVIFENGKVTDDWKSIVNTK